MALKDDDEPGTTTLVIDKAWLIENLRVFAECDWDAGADGQRDGLKNPHRKAAT